MQLSVYFKSVIEQDLCPVVLCDLNHTIIYMNPASKARYARFGGETLVGKSIFECHNAKSNELIEKVVAWFGESKDNNRIYTFRNDKENKDVYMIALRDDAGELIGYYEKHECRTRETDSLYNFK